MLVVKSSTFARSASSAPFAVAVGISGAMIGLAVGDIRIIDQESPVRVSEVKVLAWHFGVRMKRLPLTDGRWIERDQLISKGSMKMYFSPCLEFCCH